jgi:hypothetical protein
MFADLPDVAMQVDAGALAEAQFAFFLALSEQNSAKTESLSR